VVEGRNRVVVGIDGSPSSREALEWAAREARLRGDSLEAVIAWHIPPQMAYPGAPTGLYNFEESAKEVLERELDAVLGADATSVIRRVEPGPPARVLIDASRDAELLVVGSRGHGEFAGMLLGSVSQHCTSHAHCPVVVVRGD
jgi:nucleotide-binding universal stress UspA family protein